MSKRLALVKPKAERAKALTPPDRGPLLSPTRTYWEFFTDFHDDARRPKDVGRWVRQHLPPHLKVTISPRQIGYYRNDVAAWLAAQGKET